MASTTESCSRFTLSEGLTTVCMQWFKSPRVDCGHMIPTKKKANFAGTGYGQGCAVPCGTCSQHYHRCLPSANTIKSSEGTIKPPSCSLSPPNPKQRCQHPDIYKLVRFGAPACPSSLFPWVMPPSCKHNSNLKLSWHMQGGSHCPRGFKSKTYGIAKPVLSKSRSQLIAETMFKAGIVGVSLL